jgi:hypothetical protein
MPAIVIVNVQEQFAPLPSTLQQTGALVTQGGTNLSAPAASFLTQLSDLYSIIAGTHPLSNLVCGPGLTNVTVTATTASPHGLTGSVSLRILGAHPIGYDGTFTCTVTGLSTFTYMLASNPGPATVFGSFLQPGSQAPANELLSMATTFFAQGSNQGVYVLEVGTGGVNSGVTALTNYINASPQFFYAYLVPREWDGNANFIAMVNNYTAPTAKTYFLITTTTGTYSSYGGMKSAICMVESPNIAATEFSLASFLYQILSAAPSATNKTAPFAFRFVFGVTAYPTLNNSSTLATLANAAVNVIGTGAEGGISDTIIVNGQSMDGSDFLFWYSADWIQIQINLDVTNAVINGSNDSLNPLYYDQNGINRLQTVGENDLEDALTFGLATGSVTATALDGPIFSNNFSNGLYANQNVINAIPLINYTSENPGDRPIGRYAGFGVIYRPSTGFRQIVFYVVVTQFLNP